MIPEIFLRDHGAVTQRQSQGLPRATAAAAPAGSSQEDLR